jgi:hypothetical protein
MGLSQIGGNRDLAGRLATKKSRLEMEGVSQF